MSYKGNTVLYCRFMLFLGHLSNILKFLFTSVTPIHRTVIDLSYFCLLLMSKEKQLSMTEIGVVLVKYTLVSRVYSDLSLSVTLTNFRPLEQWVDQRSQLYVPFW